MPNIQLDDMNDSYKAKWRGPEVHSRVRGNDSKRHISICKNAVCPRTSDTDITYMPIAMSIHA